MEKADKKFIQQFYGKAGACVNDFKMIQENDNVLIGVSGGKDSLALLETLAGRRKYSGISFNISALFVDVKEIPYKIDLSWLEDYCKKLEVPLMTKNISVDFSKIKRNSFCFYCSWNRRKTLFETAKDIDVNKIALGHHRDDALETLMLNMISHGIISSMPGKLSMFNGQVELIRPLLYHTEKETSHFSEIMNFPLNNIDCPYSDNTRRTEIRKFLNEAEERFPAAKKNIFRSMDNIYLDYLSSKNQENSIIRDKRFI